MVAYNLAAYVMEFATLPDNDPITALPLPFNFKKYPFQMELFADMFPNIVIQKGLQVGASEYSVHKAIHACDKLGCHVMMGFPHSSQISRFSQTRIRPIVNRSEHFKAIVADRTNYADVVKRKKLYSIKDKFLYLVGVQSETEIQSESVDMVIRDEFDLMDQTNAETLLERNSASNKRMFLDLGFPTMEGLGINAQYEDSDKREYHVKCEECGTWQTIEWPRNINLKTRQRICWKCSKSIEQSLRNMKMGKWIPTQPEKSRFRHGYHISKLLFPGMDWGRLIKASENTIRLKEFYNYWLGLPFIQKDIQITESTIRECTQEGKRLPRNGKPLFMGVDVGRILHCWVEELVIEGDVRIKNVVDVKTFSGETKFSDLEEYIKGINPVAVCVDAYPETTEVMKLVKRLFGVVWALAFQDFTRKPQEEATISMHDIERGHLYISGNRTLLLDWNAEDFAKKRVNIPGEALAQQPEIIDHFKVMRRVTETIGNTNVAINRWRTPDGKPDHWAFARAACLAAQNIERWLKIAGAKEPEQDVPHSQIQAGYAHYKRRVR